MRSPAISREVKLMIALDVASTDGCITCKGDLKDMVKQAGFNDNIIVDITNKKASLQLEQRVQDMLVLSYALTRDPHELTGNTIESFRMKLGDELLVEVVATVNLYGSILETIHGLALHELVK